MILLVYGIFKLIKILRVVLITVQAFKRLWYDGLTICLMKVSSANKRNSIQIPYPEWLVVNDSVVVEISGDNETSMTCTFCM
jgi:hypothetical protein